MKNIIIGICSIALIGILLLTVYTIHGRNIRQAELNHALADAMEQTVAKTGTAHVDGPKSNEELTSLFLEKFMAQVESDSKVEIHILDVDWEKGLLSAEAVLTYLHPTGKEGSVSSRQTMIRESHSEKEEKEFCSVSYIVGEDSYKIYHIQKGSTIMVPGAPEIPGKVFQGWKELHGDGPIPLAGRKVEEDCEFVAVFQ